MSLLRNCVSNLFSKQTLSIITIVAGSFKSSSQSMGVSSTSITPHASSILELRATNKGMLVPRMTQAQRDAKIKVIEAEREAPGADRGQAIDVLVGIDPFDHVLLVQMPRQRQLDQDAIDQRIGVELVDQRDQIGLRRIRRQLVFKAGHAAFDGLLGLAGDIDLAGRILAHQHHGQPGLAPGLAFETGGLRGDAAAQGSGKGLAIDYSSLGHW